MHSRSVQCREPPPPGISSQSESTSKININRSTISNTGTTMDNRVDLKSEIPPAEEPWEQLQPISGRKWPVDNGQNNWFVGLHSRKPAVLNIVYSLPRTRRKFGTTSNVFGRRSRSIFYSDFNLSDINNRQRQSVIEGESSLQSSFAVLLVELLNSELKYHSRLTDLIEQLPACSSKHSLPANGHNAEILLSSLYRLRSTSSVFLKNVEEQLYQLKQQPDTSTVSIGALFSETFLRAFSDYKQTLDLSRAQIRNRRRISVQDLFGNATPKLLHRSDEKEKFTEYDQDNNLLSLPESRIVEYHNWLQQALAVSPSDHPDMPNLKRAVRNLHEYKLLERSSRHDVCLSDTQQKIAQVERLFPKENLDLLGRTYWGSQSALNFSYNEAPTQSETRLVFKSSKLPLSSPRRKLSPAVAASAAFEMKQQSSVASTSSASCSSTAEFGGGGAGEARRCYVKEGPAIFSSASHSHERYLFLFNDLLLVAKEKERLHSYKLKERVRLSEVWLREDGLDIIADAVPANQTACCFVIGWPTTNYVIQFQSVEERDDWYSTLKRYIEYEKDREYPKSVKVRVQCKNARSESTSRHSNSAANEKFDYKTTLQVTNQQTASEVFSRAIGHLGRGANANDYQLWVYSDRERAPYALYGHEFPFAIQLSHLRDLFVDDQSELNEQMMEQLSAFHFNHKCLFLIKPRRSASLHSKKQGPPPLKQKRSTTANIVTQLKRRMMSKQDSVDSPQPPPSPTGKLFGHPLSALCQNGESGSGLATGLVIPKSVKDMLNHLMQDGLFCRGIFRMTPKATCVKELRERLDAGLEIDLRNTSPYITASVLKEYLRSLPDSLLVSEKFNAWMSLLDTVTDQNEQCPKLSRARQLLSELPRANYELLRHLICLLYNVSAKHKQNQMTALNLAICFGYTLLLPQHELTMGDGCKRIYEVTQLLIENAEALFGRDTLELLGPARDRPPSSQDSSEDSDSMGLLNKHDTSSVDSLIGVGPSPAGSRPPSSQPSALYCSNGRRATNNFLASKDSGLENPNIIDEQDTDLLSSSSSAGGLLPRSFSQSDDNLDEDDTDYFLLQRSKPSPLSSKKLAAAKSLEHLPAQRGLNISVDQDSSISSTQRLLREPSDRRRRQPNPVMTQSWCGEDLNSLLNGTNYAKTESDSGTFSKESLSFCDDSCTDLHQLSSNLLRNDQRTGRQSNRKATGVLHRSESGEHLVINVAKEVSAFGDSFLRNSLRSAVGSSTVKKQHALQHQSISETGAMPKMAVLSDDDLDLDTVDSAVVPVPQRKTSPPKAQGTLQLPIDHTPPEPVPFDQAPSSPATQSVGVGSSPFGKEPEFVRHSGTRKPARHRKTPLGCGATLSSSSLEHQNNADTTTSDSGHSVSSSLSSLTSSEDHPVPAVKRTLFRDKTGFEKSGSDSIEECPQQQTTCCSSIVLQCSNARRSQGAVIASVPVPCETALTYIIGAGSSPPTSEHGSGTKRQESLRKECVSDSNIVVKQQDSQRHVTSAQMLPCQHQQEIVRRPSLQQTGPKTDSAVHYSNSAVSTISAINESPPVLRRAGSSSLGTGAGSSGAGSRGSDGLSAHQALGLLRSSPFLPYGDFVQRLYSTGTATSGSCCSVGNDSSTVTETSSDESTPHVSRENSRAQELEQKATKMFPQKSTSFASMTDSSSQSNPLRAAAAVSKQPITSLRASLTSLNSAIQNSRRLPSYHEALQARAVPASVAPQQRHSSVLLGTEALLLGRESSAHAQNTSFASGLTNGIEAAGKNVLDKAAYNKDRPVSVIAEPPSATCASHKLTISVVPISQSRAGARIKRYDRENLRRKTLGGLEYRKLSQLSSPGGASLQRTNSCERLANENEATQDSNQSKQPIRTTEIERLFEKSGQSNRCLNAAIEIPEVSWSVQKLRQFYSAQKDLLAPEILPRKTAVVRVAASSQAMPKPCEALLTRNAVVPTTSSAVGPLLRDKSAQELSSTNARTTRSQLRYSSYEPQTNSFHDFAPANSTNQNPVLKQVPKTCLTSSQHSTSSVSGCANENVKQQPWQIPHAKPLLQHHHRHPMLSGVALEETPGNYPVLVPPPLAPCADQNRSLKPLRLATSAALPRPNEKLPPRPEFSGTQNSLNQFNKSDKFSTSHVKNSVQKPHQSLV